MASRKSGAVEASIMLACRNKKEKKESKGDVIGTVDQAESRAA